MSARAVTLLLALGALALCALSTPAAAEPPGPCGWTIDLDGSPLAIPLDRPLAFGGRHWNNWNCEPGLAPLAIDVRDADGAPVAGGWTHDSIRDLVVWTPDGGWPGAGTYALTVDYVYADDPGFDPQPAPPWRIEAELRIGDALAQDGYAVEITDFSLAGSEEPEEDCCPHGPCWTIACHLDLSAQVDWTISGPTGEPLAPAPWFWLEMELAPSPDAAGVVRWWGSVDERPRWLDPQMVPACVRTRLVLLPEGGALATSPWRCAEDYARMGEACTPDSPPMCPPDEPEPEPPIEPEPDPEPEPEPEPEPAADGGLGADGGPAVDEGEVPARGRSGCAALPGAPSSAPWGLLGLFLVGFIARVRRVKG